MGAERRQVVITGIGVITPLGNSLPELWAAVRQGRSAIRRLTRFEPEGFRSQLAAEVPAFDVTDYVDARQARRLDRFSAFAVAAANLAVRDAGIPLHASCLCQGAVAVGSALGGVAFAEEQHARYQQSGLRAVEP
ncbi:MAG TPA: beta-ketoacyl synthase N-terminal-like domain-containing protein, partial [Chloroflexota bacterium]|nr:beta-ketoacyl synthase N-terminal-like domain-containing protein [Chloroflexota bacterium]